MTLGLPNGTICQLGSSPARTRGSSGVLTTLDPRLRGGDEPRVTDASAWPRMLGGVALLMSIVACAREPAAAKSAHAARAAAAPNGLAAPTATVVADSSAVTAPLALAAQLYVERDAVVAARTAGVLQSIAVDLGSEVAAGAPVARIESAAQELAVAHADAAQEATRRTLERLRALLAARGVTPAEVEQSELAARQAGVAAREARRQLALTRVTAPFGGVVTARSARAGQLVAAGDTLLRIAEHGPLLARVRVPEAFADLRPGDAATVVGLRGVWAAARVTRLAPAIDPASGTREVVVQLAEVPNAGAAAMLPGASVEVRLGRQERRVLAVPRGAVRPGGWVLVVDGDRSTLRSVATGDSIAGDRVEVVRGLSAGERVAVGRMP